MAAIQFGNARLIDAATCAQWQKLASANLAVSHGWLNRYRSMAAASQQSRAPQKLMKRAAEGYRRGVLGVTELAGWYRQDADAIAEELGSVETPDIDGDAEFWGEGADPFPGDAR
ncbi:MAG TPA: hypothetical protein VMB79_08770 [Jatrophihabitans sp.]|nr:hypothetical protein [Jatrophihabitans sp.]